MSGGSPLGVDCFLVANELQESFVQITFIEVLVFARGIMVSGHGLHP